MNKNRFLPSQTTEVLEKIADYYFNMYNDVNAAIDELHDTIITNLIITHTKVIIVTARPGLLIGKRGERIEELQTALGKKIEIIEDSANILDYMACYLQSNQELENDEG
jgi:ribosomal protein S3